MSRKEEIKELFTFTDSERKGFIVLLVILFILITARVVVNRSTKEISPLDSTKFIKEIQDFRATLKAKESDDYLSRLDKYILARYDTINLHSFNPNNLSKEEWLRLGLTEKQIKSIHNYLSKGGKFLSKDDFRRMYGIRTKQFQILEPFIDLPERSYGNYSKSYRDYSPKNEIPEPDSLFKFNPNTATVQELEALGLSYKQAKAVDNYRKSGGVFQEKSDFKKIYSLKDKQYSMLENYITIPENTENNKEPELKKTKVNINTMSVEELKNRGRFWEYHAKNIVNYRNRLGGYSKKEQLLEVYGVKEEYYKKIENDIAPVKKLLNKIHINFSTVSELGKHPYISYYAAKSIVDYRDKNGAFKSIAEIRKFKLVSETSYKKLKPYLTIN
ncbi:MAG: helix-hairpin-helix domain-containing protein [Bacteroidota bacterium]|nr:helix-hairpin-helix domain-containing protein [Bacteroidota bacterium]